MQSRVFPFLVFKKLASSPTRRRTALGKFARNMKPNAVYSGPTLELFSFYSIVRILLLNLSIMSDESNLNYLDFRVNPPAVELPQQLITWPHIQACQPDVLQRPTTDTFTAGVH